jgi:hypothetical protein
MANKQVVFSILFYFVTFMIVNAYIYVGLGPGGFFALYHSISFCN